MDSLLCDEVSVVSPAILKNQNRAISVAESSESYNDGSFFYTTKQDSHQAFEICLQKELVFMPESGYHDHLLQSSSLILARFRAIEWLVKTQSRLSLGSQTVFNAANYFDRFLSMKQCNGWKYWMFELLATACLSVASKFGETAHLPFHEIQMEDLDHSFQPGLIQRMELTLLKALGWRVGSITAYSYIELLLWNIDSLNSFITWELINRVTDLLLGTLFDPTFLKFRPSVIAISALRRVIQKYLPSTYNAHLASITRLIPEDQKDDLIKCYKIIEQKSIARRRQCYCCPSSPVTVLKMEKVGMCNCQVDFSLSKLHGFNANLKTSKMKRKRDE